MAAPFFSIIIPTFNRSQRLLVAVQSVQQQTFKDFEIVVVDDGGSDDSKEMLRQLNDPRIKYLRQENAGPSAARNTGIAAAIGKYFLFLDSDDSLTPGVLQAHHHALLANGAQLSFSYASYLNERGEEFVRIKPSTNHGAFGPRLSGAFAIDASLLGQVGGYDPQLFYSENTDLFIRIQQQPNVSATSVTGDGVIIRIMNTSDRSQRYMGRKYKSAQHFVAKHRTYLAGHPNEFVNNMRVLAFSAFHSGQYGEARSAILAVIRQKPFAIKSYLQFLLYSIVPLGKLYFVFSRKLS